MDTQVTTFDSNYNFAQKSSFRICTVKNSERYEAISGNIRQIIEPPQDKTNKMTVCPAKSQISLGIHPV